MEEITSAGGHAIAIVADVAERGAPKRVVSQAESELGPVDILINNAAISRIGRQTGVDDLEYGLRMLLTLSV